MPSTITDRLNGLTTSVAVKAPCRAGTTAAITLSGLQTVDGVVLAAGDRVLVKNQSAAVDNGIWIVQTGTWSRAPDFDGSFDIVGGTSVKVNLGTINAASLWEVDGDGVIDINSDAITFTSYLIPDREWSVLPSVTDAIAGFLSTTTDVTASLPNTAQQPLFIPAGIYDAGSNVTIAMTGAAQVVHGDGSNSVLSDASLKWQGFSYGGAHDMQLRGTSDYGVQIVGQLSQRTSYTQLSNLTIRSKSVAGFSVDGTDSQLGVSNIMGSDLMLIGNQRNLDIGLSANTYLQNIFSIAGVEPSRFWGIGELKITNGSFGAPTTGPALSIRGSTAKQSLESYFLNCNFNQGSNNNNTAITIEPYNAGTQLKVTVAAGVDCAPGWAQFYLTSTTYGTLSRWSVNELLSLTEIILSPISGVSPAGPYATTEAGTYHRQYAGLDMDADNPTNINDMWFFGGASNNTRFNNVFNVTMMQRGGFAKERAYFEGQNNRVLAVGSLRGRNTDTYQDIWPCGPASHTGWSAFATFDPTATLAPGNVMTGPVAPMKDWGVLTTTNQVGAIGYLVASETGPRIGVGPIDDMDDYHEWYRTGLAEQLALSAIGSFRVTSDRKVHGLEIVGRDSPGAPIIQPYGPATNIGVDYKTKGTGGHDFYMESLRQVRMVHIASADTYLQLQGGVNTATIFPGADSVANAYMDVRSRGNLPVRLRSGTSGTTRFIVGDTGIAFYGSAEVAKQTITGSRGGNAALADLLTKLATLGLITDGTSA